MPRRITACPRSKGGSDPADLGAKWHGRDFGRWGDLIFEADGGAVRILLADDHAEFRDGLKALLGSSPDLEVAGEAADGEEAVAMATSLQPDVVLMDLNMPNLDGIEATRKIVAASPHISVLVLTMLEDNDSLFAALQAGARGYLLKGALRAEIVRSVRAVASGEAIFGPQIAKRLLQFFSGGRPMHPSGAFGELTTRENEILRLMTEHRTNPEIARKLGISEKTVRNHVSNIFSKLQVADRAEAIARARDAGADE